MTTLQKRAIRDALKALESQRRRNLWILHPSEYKDPFVYNDALQAHYADLKGAKDEQRLAIELLQDVLSEE